MLSLVIKSGRGYNGAHRDSGTVVHLIEGKRPNGFWGGKALCGTEPGYKGNGWHPVNREVSCEKCKKQKTIKYTH